MPAPIDDTPADGAPFAASKPARADDMTERGSTPGGKPAPLKPGSQVDEIVQEIRAGLTHISARELELRRREQDFDRQYESLKLAAQRATVTEYAEARRQLAQQAAELSAQAEELSTRRTRLSELADQVHAQQIELEQQRAAVALRSQRTQQRADELRTWQAQQEHVLQERVAALRRHEDDLKQRVQRARADLTRDREELDSRAAELAAQAAARAGPEASADDVQQAYLREQQAALKAEKTRLADRAADFGRRTAELADQQVELDAARQKIQEAERDLDRQRQELTALREQAETRENEARQAALLLEVERQSLERQPQTTGRRPVPQEAKSAQSAPAHRLATGWRRRAAIAAAVGLVTACGWWVGHPAVYRATVPIQITSANPDVAAVARAHRRGLLGDNWFVGDPIAAAWRTACDESRVTVLVVPNQAALRSGNRLLTCAALKVGVSAPQSADATQLACAAAAAYARHVQAESTAGRLPPGYEDVVARRAQLEAALREARRLSDGAAPAVPASDESQGRVVLGSQANSLEADLDAVNASLARQRSDLAALVAADIPLGTVDLADVDKTLAADAIYEEDRQEHAGVALQYRTELSVSMLVFVDPQKAMHKALGEFAGVLQEQRDLQPPAEIGALLERCAAIVARVQERCTGLSEQWRPWLDAVQTMNVRDDVLELVRHQALVAEGARVLSDALTGAVNELGTELDRLDRTGDGHTRAVVVGAVLRSEHAALKSTVDAYVAAAGQTALAENFQLDALDRKLRGLRTRLSSREEAVHQRLQLDADRATRELHAARVEQTRAAVRELEQRRAELVTNLATIVRELRDQDEVARQRDVAETAGRQRAAQVQWLEARSADLQKQLDEMLQQLPEPDHLEVGEPTTLRRQAASLSHQPGRDSLIAGSIAFAAAWLIGASLTGWKPGREGT